eukprot:gene8278-9162_t
MESEEGTLFQYLHGSISFNEWLDHQDSNVNFVEGLLGAGNKARNVNLDATSQGNSTLNENLSEDYNDLPMHDDSLWDNVKFHSSIDEYAFEDDAVDYANANESEDEDEQLSDLAPDIQYSPMMVGAAEENSFEWKLPNSPGILESETGISTEDQNAQNVYKLIKIMSGVLSQSSQGSNSSNPVEKSVLEFAEPKTKRLRKSGPSSHKLREDLRQQMGVANLYLAKGQIDEAVDTCMEIIRQAPHNPHAFKTLSLIYEEKGDAEKALQFALISAFIGCGDALEWRDLAQRCLQAGNRKQALLCYSRGCKISQKNVVLQWERAALYFENKDYKKALDCYQSVLKIISDHDIKQSMDMAKEMAHIQHDYDQYEKAVDILEFMFNKYPHNIDSEGLNILAELHLSLKNFERALQVICSYADVKIPGIIPINSEHEDISEKAAKYDETKDNNSQNTSDMNSSSKVDTSPNTVHEYMHTDLTSLPSSWTEFLLSPRKGSEHCPIPEQTPPKRFIDLDEHKNQLREASNQPDFLQDEQVEQLWHIPDVLPIDIRVKTALCLIQLNKQCNVEHILSPLRKENIEDVGDLYLDIAEAYIDVGKHEDAIPYLEALVKVEKYSMAAVWLKLAECKGSVGRVEEAIDSYYYVLKLAPDQLSVRLELSNLCRSVGRNDESVAILSEQNDFSKEDAEDHSVPQITKKEDFVLWYQKCTILHGQGETSILAENGYIFFVNYFRSAAISRDDGLSKAVVWEMLLKVLQAMVCSGKTFLASDTIEKALTFRPFCDNKRYRLEIDFLGATVYYLTSEYSKAFDMFRWALIRSEKKGLHRNSMWNFLARIVNNMNDRKHHKYILRLLFKQPAILPLIIMNGHNAFLCGSYKCALGLVHLSVIFYNKALEFPMTFSDKDVAKRELDTFHCLHREVAYNLALIYKNSGNNDLARRMLFKYIWL